MFTSRLTMLHLLCESTVAFNNSLKPTIIKLSVKNEKNGLVNV